MNTKRLEEGRENEEIPPQVELVHNVPQGSQGDLWLEVMMF